MLMDSRLCEGGCESRGVSHGEWGSSAKKLLFGFLLFYFFISRIFLMYFWVGKGISREWDGGHEVVVLDTHCVCKEEVG